MLLVDFLDNHEENIFHIKTHMMKDGNITLTLDWGTKV